jgi:UDPglucose 6-dehydrogenase
VALDVVAAAERANARQKLVLPRKLERHFFERDESVANKRIAVWGLAFKPGTDDLREAPALTLIDRLLERGARIVAYDPAAADNARSLYGERIELAPSMYAAVEGADALVLVTEWHEFRRPNFERIRRALRSPVLLDGRNLWDPVELRVLGFTYHGIGRPRC